MTNFFQEKGTEAAKLFSGILVFGVFGKWDVIPKDYFAGELVKILADAAISFLVVFLVTEVIFGRPVIRLEWRTDSKERPLSGEVAVADKTQIMNLQIKASRETALQRVLLHLSQRRNFSLEVAFHPEGLVSPVKQGGTDSFKCRDKKLVFDRVRVESGTTIGAADFTLKHKRPDYAHEVSVKVTACWEPRLLRLPVKLARIQRGVDTLVLGG